MNKLLYPIVIMALMLISPSVNATDFATWKAGFKQTALKKGISSATFDSAFANAKPINRVIELDRKQPEGKFTFAQYKKRVINDARIQQGRRLYKKHFSLLKEIEAKYGVQPQYVVALWGIETSYGNNTGGFNIIPALATLAWEGRRRAFFERELINALTILEEGHIGVKDFKGSWAGAMGQNQFMPSSFNAYAVDYSGDGRRDIWKTLPDVFASSSNYLKKNGWNAGERWGREVKLTQQLPSSLTGLKQSRSLSAWQNMGVRTISGNNLSSENFKASLVQPDGATGPSYLVYNNYKTIMDWNRSIYFATSVSLLADQIAAK